MAVTRYDQRKNYEEAEANAIGTEYVRADLLPAADAVSVRELLRRYLDARIASYLSPKEREIGETDTEGPKLQAALWSAILPAANTRPNTCDGPCRLRHERCAELCKHILKQPGGIASPLRLGV